MKKAVRNLMPFHDRVHCNASVFIITLCIMQSRRADMQYVTGEVCTRVRASVSEKAGARGTLRLCYV